MGAIVLVGTLASVVFHAVIALFTDLGWPYTTFLFKPEARFYDFLEVYGNAHTFGNYGEITISYSGLFHLLTMALAAVPSAVSWLLVTAAFLLVLAAVVRFGVTARVGGRAVRDAYILIFCLCSYPVLFLLDRGNLEMIVFVLLAAFVYLYYVKASAWAWLPLSLACAGKYYWMVLLVLLISDRRWRQMIATLAGTLAFTVVSAVVLGWASGLGAFGVLRSTLGTLEGHAERAASSIAVQHGHTLFAIPYFIDRKTGYWLQIHLNLSDAYLAVAAGVFLIVSVRVLFYDVEPWRKLTAMVVCAIFLPFESHDYTMVHLLLPLALFGAWGARTTRRGGLYAVLFGLLLVPLDYVQLGVDVSYSSLAYAVLLLILLVSALTDGARLRSTAVEGHQASLEAPAEVRT